MARLLIIGGSGFFGKSFLDAYRRTLLKKWSIDSITILARNAKDLHLTHPHLIGNSVSLLNCDITVCDDLPEADFIIHAAASTNAKNYLLYSEKEKQNILAGVYNYRKLAKSLHSGSQILYCSSGAVYGPQRLGISEIHEGYTEGMIEHIAVNKHDYAIAKINSENVIKAMGSDDGLSVCIARCFAFVGAYLPLDQHFAIGNFIADGLSGVPVNVKADRKVYRSYMYMDDLVLWLMTMVSNARPSCPIWNVGSDQPIEIMDLASKIASIFDVSIFAPKLRDTPEIDRYIPCIQKAKAELGLELNVDLDEAIRKTINQISKNPII